MMCIWTVIPQWDARGTVLVVLFPTIPLWLLAVVGFTKLSVPWVLLWFVLGGLSIISPLADVGIILLLLLYKYLERQDALLVKVVAVLRPKVCPVFMLRLPSFLLDKVRPVE